ncbi:flagellar hook-associated protein FlgK [Salibacterium salarium]|uniref:Flagellar hook-associated protein 1 n=1 Tax=Salibacterium salarium TaxID=284579 RepID=A0A3R9P2Y6_9BACI|nr:flagellar hook-associated protein FlgK [Salibacterium salarium]RSL29955.1 flagellar hook-associated protein FlgK [Salibacterium salarium]
MTSTFHGLETARRGMATQQAALQTTGHNISNAETDGYSRQRVNFAQTEPYPDAARNAPQMPGQIGTGVQADFVQRIRTDYLDQQYRGENSQSSYWETKHSSLERIEDVMNEPSDDGLSSQMNEFYNALQDLSANPQDSGARSVVKEQGVALADTFNYMDDTLKTNRQDLKNQITVNENEINSLMSNINSVNEQIGRVEPNGQMPNDHYDERDRLLDDLSEKVNIEVENLEPEGLAEDAADGKVNVYLLDGEGNRMTDSDDEDIKLIDGESMDYREFEISEENDDTVEINDSSNINLSWAKGESDDPDNVKADLTNSPGSLNAMLEDYGVNNDSEVSGTYPEVMQDLDNLASDFAGRFNEVHQSGRGLNEIENENNEDNDFFSFNADGAAGSIQVDEDIRDDPDNIAAAPAGGAAGDGSNATALSNVRDEDFNGDYQSMIGELAVQTSEAEQKMNNTASLRDNVDSRRQEVSSVSLDEEMTNMIQYQHAYNAAARNITNVDEMLDRIINNMGLVGR